MLFNIWVTNRCNMDCSYCYEGKHKKLKLMDTVVANKIISYVVMQFNKSNRNTLVVNYHGGEPLINLEIVKYLTTRFKEAFGERVSFGMTTNATLLNEETAEFLSRNFRYNLSVSIDGDRETHDRNRVFHGGKGSYDIVTKNIRLLLSRRKDVRARMTYTPESVCRLYSNIEHLIRMGFSVIVPVPDYSDRRWNEGHAAILEEETLKLYKKYADNNSVRISIVNPAFHLVKGRCNAGEGEINIDCDGSLYPCTCMVSNSDYYSGTVERPLIDKITAAVREGESVSSDCTGCGLAHWCIGARCKLVNKTITGEYGNPPTFLCAETNAIYNAYCRYCNAREQIEKEG